ncbi:flavin-containing monooxygenase [Nocardia brevicatena]|uniref:flavin-containing monooxygenase n=1 Tax=Nocardia brevicatena TaxID=37327 RepID=UPI000688AFA5|nr:NAD(P)/FAD-dependent oxidoreductase [Nocardia brevicatena]
MSDYRVAVVGAGFGGIGMGVALRRAGIDDFVILEKGVDIGGVWRDNTYPGCDCDVPSHLYSFSFAPYRSRRIRYPGQAEILDYLWRVADEHGLRPYIRPATAVTEAAYLDGRGRWELTTATGQRLVAEMVVFAVGQLHRPYIPQLPWVSAFAGPAFHTARWEHDHDLRGRDIAVIGTGSSAAQALPALVRAARRVRVFQRTPHWVLPKPGSEFGPVCRVALGAPGAHRLYRALLHRGADTVLAPVMHRGWSARPVEWFARGYLRWQVPDPELRAHLTPDYPIGGKRIVIDSHYYRTLRRPDVDLITARIRRPHADGIETVDVRRHPADVLVYATGFRAPEFLVPIAVYSRGGVSLHQQWSRGARAFLGVAVRGYPNAFLIAGPNTFNPAGSNPTMKEYQIDYIIRCLRWREEIGAAAIEVDTDAMLAHQSWLDRALRRTVWAATGSSWYKHSSGRITNPWPASAREYARMLRHSPGESFGPVPEDVRDASVRT